MNRIFPITLSLIIVFFIHEPAFPSHEAKRVAALLTPPADPPKILSPDSALEFNVYAEKGQLRYSVAFHGKPIIEASPLGLILDNANLGEGVSLGKPDWYEANATLPCRGKHSMATDHYKGARIPVEHKLSKVRYTLEVRVYNDGVAFRYVVPGNGARVLNGEATGFLVPAGSTVWHHGIASMHYEEKHKKSDVSAIRANEWVAPPMTIRLPGELGYASITESGIIKSRGENFPGMALQADGQRGFRARFGHEHPPNYPFILRYGEEDQKRLQAPPLLHGNIEAPWRVILVGADLNTLFNSDIIFDVAPEPDPRLFPNGFNEAWMKPGRAAWGYLTKEPRTLEGMKNLSRLAGELGFEYHVVEGHWAKWTEAEQKEFVEFSNQHHVKLIFWKHSKDLRDPVKRHAFFQQLHDLGVAGAKIDFFDHEAKDIIDLYAACLREAAEYKLVLDFHGANKPTGQDRTWPNEMAREAVFGMEFRGPWAKHNTTLPFTRLLAGHMDYTVVTFGDRKAETSETHQLASALVLQAPLLVFSEHPQNLLEHPAVDFIKQIPAVWDETIVLPPSAIGEVAAFARRSGEKWFVSVMNGEAERSIPIDLSFLGQGEYQAMMVQDKRPDWATVSLVRSRKTFGGQKGVNVIQTTVSNKESLSVDLLPGGGFVAVFSK